MSSGWQTPPSKKQTGEALLFVLNYKTRRVLIETPRNYDLLQFSIRRHFPEIPVDHRITYHTKNLTVCEGALAEISPDIWATAIPLLKSVIVLSEPFRARLSTTGKKSNPEESINQQALEAAIAVLDTNRCKNHSPQPGSNTHRRQTQASIPPSPEQLPRDMTLNVHIDGQRFSVECHYSMCIHEILAELSLESLDRNLLISGGYDIMWNGTLLSEEQCKERSIRDIGIKTGKIIEVSEELKFAKPVVYLLPPAGTEIQVTLRLSLTPEWHFSAIYPVVPINTSPSGAQTLQWCVRASSDGVLLEKATGLEVAYLFWEANRAPAIVPPQAGEREPLGVDAFIPNKPELDPLNSVVLEVANMTPYLDRSLKALGLHTEARTSFITYWLPSFLKHKYIALQFLSQSVYERMAPLEVAPAPDVVVRVFMLFKGLKADEVAPEGEWSQVFNASMDDVARWRNIVGIDENRSLADDSLFRVVEWGGMEVPT